MQPCHQSGGLPFKAVVGEISSCTSRERTFISHSQTTGTDPLPLGGRCFSFLQKVTEKLHKPCFNNTDMMSDSKTKQNLPPSLMDTNSHSTMCGGAPNPNELERRLKDLSLLNCSAKTRHTYNHNENGDSNHLSSACAHSLMVPVISPSPRQDEKRRAELQHETVTDMADHYRQILQDIGEDTTRQGLLKTPERAAKALLYFTKGYDEKISGE